MSTPLSAPVMSRPHARRMAPHIPFSCAPLQHPAVRRYDADWRVLRRDPAALRRAATWNVVACRIDSLDDVLVAVGYERAPAPETEANLRRLVERARSDTLAAQVVVRRLVPGALSLAARRNPQHCADAVSELLGALWIAIRTFDSGRRPACLAAALLADADYRTFRGGYRRRLSEVPGDSVGDRPAAEPEPEPAHELDELVKAATAAGVADRDDLALLRLLLTEPSPASVAARLDVTERTVRNRRARLTAKLRDVAAGTVA